MTTALVPSSFRELALRIEAEIARVIVGQRDVVRHTLIALLANGHVLLEGLPGLGKTMLVRTLAAALQLEFTRVQFTPDLMPADILGTDVLEIGAGGERHFRFHRGPIFTNLLLADEINRATPKTQSALLEAMQERQATVGGVTYPLPTPFLVLATQNPIELEGTYPLPEAQRGRFVCKVQVGYPSVEELAEITARTTGAQLPAATPCANCARTPFSTLGMYSFGIRPPTTFSSNSKATSESSGSGSKRPLIWANWPEPPVCFLWV